MHKLASITWLRIEWWIWWMNVACRFTWKLDVSGFCPPPPLSNPYRHPCASHDFKKMDIFTEIFISVTKSLECEDIFYKLKRGKYFTNYLSIFQGQRPPLAPMFGRPCKHNCTWHWARTHAYAFVIVHVSIVKWDVQWIGRPAWLPTVSMTPVKPV